MNFPPVSANPHYIARGTLIRKGNGDAHPDSGYLGKLLQWGVKTSQIFARSSQRTRKNSWYETSSFIKGEVS